MGEAKTLIAEAKATAGRFPLPREVAGGSCLRCGAACSTGSDVLPAVAADVVLAGRTNAHDAGEPLRGDSPHEA